MLVLSFVIFINMSVYATAETNRMPIPFAYGGGDENDLFYHYDVSKFGSPEGNIIDIFAEYIGHYDFMYRQNGFSFYPDIFYVSSLMDTTNYYNMIVTYNIPDEVIIRAFEKYNAHFRSFYDENHPAYASTIFFDDDIEVILSRDEAAILAHFATEYVIVIKDRVYSPAWIYWHDIEAYKTAGITSEMIQERLHLYAEFPFTDEATLAFELKLSEFLGREVVLINERVMTTADALIVLRAIAGLTALTPEQLSRYWISGEPTTEDALEILRIVAGLA
jgi:hypothetical protein